MPHPYFRDMLPTKPDMSFSSVHTHLQPHAAAIWQRQAIAQVQQRQRQANKRGCMLLIAILSAGHKDQGVSCVEDAQALRYCCSAMKSNHTEF